MALNSTYRPTKVLISSKLKLFQDAIFSNDINLNHVHVPVLNFQIYTTVEEIINIYERYSIQVQHNSNDNVLKHCFRNILYNHENRASITVSIAITTLASKSINLLG